MASSSWRRLPDPHSSSRILTTPALELRAVDILRRDSLRILLSDEHARELQAHPPVCKAAFESSCDVGELGEPASEGADVDQSHSRTTVYSPDILRMWTSACLRSWGRRGSLQLRTGIGESCDLSESVNYAVQLSV